MTDSVADFFSGGGGEAVSSAASTAATASAVLSAVSQAGAVMAIVGAVTGNQDLLKIGGAMGVVGGIGGYAVDAYNGSPATGAQAAPALSGGTGGDTQPTDLSNTGVDQAASAAQGTMDTATTGAMPGLNTQPMNNPSAFTATGGQPATNNPSAFTAAGAPAPAADQGTTPAATGVQDVSAPSVAGVNTPAGVAGAAIGAQKADAATFWSGLTNTLKSAKPETLLTLGGQILSGAAQGYNASQANQLNKDRLGILQQQMSNGKSTASYNYTNKAK